MSDALSQTAQGYLEVLFPTLSLKILSLPDGSGGEALGLLLD
jgi:hypothetical protein